MRIIYFCTYPSKELLTQLHISILLVKAALPKSDIHIFSTDESLGRTWPIHLHFLSKDKLTEWQGTHQFFWRIKMKVIEEMSQIFPESKLLYLDADTLPINLEELENNLNAPMMHCCEGALKELRTKTERKMLKQLNGKVFEDILVTGNSKMFNAGLIAIPANSAGKIARSIALCDAFLDWQVIPRLLEQLAFSLVLNKNDKIKEGHRYVAHYWSTKDLWATYLEEWLKKHGSMNFEKQVAAVHSLDLEAFPYWAKRSNTVRRVRRIFGFK